MPKPFVSLSTPEKLERFFQVWDKKVRAGQASPLDRAEIMALRIFADWCNDKEKTQ
jgi:hypothetical protein